MEFYKSKFSDKKKSRNQNSKRPIRSYRNFRDENKTSAIISCANCGDECEIPFVPKTNRPVFCKLCFRKNKPDEKSSSKNYRFGRNSKSDYSKNDYSKSKVKNDKFLKKQEKFLSNGSEKFYSTIKEKLFQILGGKICSSCGFRDERALGFSHIYDDAIFDNVRRSGAVSSWAKYISDPELARKELNVLCLNCNEIRQPVSKPTRSNSSNPKKYNKKSRFFPR